MLNAAWSITDLSLVIPAENRSSQSRPGLWQIVPYTTDDGPGQLVLANPDTGAPDIEVEVPLEGEYDIYIGMHENYCDRIHVKLNDDRSFYRLRHSLDVAAKPAIQQVFWRRANLSAGSRLIIRQEPGYRISIASVTAVPALPTPEYPKEYLVHITDDGFPANWGMPRDDNDATWHADGYAMLGVDTISYGTNITGMANYPTRHASLRLPLEEIFEETFSGQVYRQAVELMLDRDRRGFNVPASFAEQCGRQGMTVSAYARMAHAHCPPPYECFRSTFFDAHPELRCIDATGTPVNRLSMAYPEVRQQFLTLFDECLDWGAHGISDVFVRGLPLVLWEEPVRKALGGIAVGALPEDDPRLFEARASFITTFMRDQREISRRHGDAPVTIVVPATPAIARYFALDVEQWIAEGLIDVLCPYRWGDDAANVPLDMDGWCAMVKGSPVKLLPFINTWRDKDGLSFIREALRLSDWPIDGFSIWDVLHRPPCAHLAARAMHSRAAMEDALVELERGPIRQMLRTFAGMRHDAYNFGWIL